MQPIAHFRSPFPSKFGIPRQSNLVSELEGEIIFIPQWRTPDALRGLEGFDYIWLIWEFSAHSKAIASPTVRPPLLGGNERMGVFATRSSYRPNPIGLSSVKIINLLTDTPRGPIIRVAGADLMDGTPILDIKPYLPQVDSHPQARSGFTQTRPWPMLQVILPPSVANKFSPSLQAALIHALQLDPRPHYHQDPQRIYGMPFAGQEIHFQVTDNLLTVLEE